MDGRRTFPHVLIFPCPAQGHVNSMLKLADLLSLAAVSVTFLNSEYNHRRLLRHAAAEARFSRYPGFRFRTIPDGLPDDHPRSGDSAVDVIRSFMATAAPRLKELIASDATVRPITCIVADGVMGFAIDAAKEFQIPVIYFRTISACSLWAYYCIPLLIQSGEFPFQGNDMDRPIQSIPGMEALIRRRDLPSFLRRNDPSDPTLLFVASETRRTSEARGLILNTFPELEAPVLAHIRSHCPVIYTIGPIHELLKSRITGGGATTPSSPLSNSLWEEERTSIAWLDVQPSDSVIYVSFGSITVMTREEEMEIWHGLVNSGKRFLWAALPESMAGEGARQGVPAEVEEGTRERGFMVGWAPQEEVLAHRAVGGFLTHGGWNSTLESLAAGKPMVCWPYFGDQQTNSRFVAEVWGTGVDMKDRCERATVEGMVREVMDEGPRRAELVRAAAEMADSIRRCVGELGSSSRDLNRLIEDIRSTSEPGDSISAGP